MEKMDHVYVMFRVQPRMEILLQKTFGCCRFIYNQMLADKIDHYKVTKKMLKNTPAQYKNSYSFLKEVDSLVANVRRSIRCIRVGRRIRNATDP